MLKYNSNMQKLDKNKYNSIFIVFNEIIPLDNPKNWVKINGFFKNKTIFVDEAKPILNNRAEVLRYLMNWEFEKADAEFDRKVNDCLNYAIQLLEIGQVGYSFYLQMFGAFMWNFLQGNKKWEITWNQIENTIYK